MSSAAKPGKPLRVNSFENPRDDETPREVPFGICQYRGNTEKEVAWFRAFVIREYHRYRKIISFALH
jgi:hypothetical protein